MGRGAPFTEPQDPNFVRQEDASWSLGRNREARSPGVAAKPQVRSPGEYLRGEGEQHMKISVFHIAGEAAALHSLLSPFPFCSFWCLPGTVTGLYSLALCGLQQWSSGSPSAQRETQGREVMGGCGQGRRTNSAVEIKEGFHEEVAVEISWR